MTTFTLLLPAASSSPAFLWGSFRLLEVLIIYLILSGTWFCNGTLELGCTKEMTMNVDYKSYDMYEDSYNASFLEQYISDLDPHCLPVNPVSYLGLSNTCYGSNLFCMQLPSSSLLSDEDDSREAFLRSSDVGSIVKKEEESLQSQKSDMINLDTSHCSMPMLLEVNPHLLDWGHGYLHLPMFAFLTVTNGQKDNVLRVYKPFSTDPQFYACNHSESLLDPGEVALICFVFHPTHLGTSSAHLVIQTSIGGFVIQGKGFAVLHPVEDETIEMQFIPHSGWWGKIMSLLYPLNVTVYGMEVKTNLPGFMRSLFKKILLKLSAKKIHIVSFLAVSLIILKYCFAVPPLLHQIQKTHLVLGGNNLMPTTSTYKKSPHMHLNPKSSVHSVSYKMDVRHSSEKKSATPVLDSIDNNENSVVAAADSVVSHCAESESVNHWGDNMSGKSKEEQLVTSQGTKTGVVLKTDGEDATNIVTMAVKIGKEKRRKKRGKGPRAGVAASSESPGSQSGYSTPPSPLSPITTVLLPNKSAIYSKMEKFKKPKSPIKTFTSQFCEKSVVLEESSNANDINLSFKTVLAAAPKQIASKSVLVPSATFSVPNIHPPYFLPPYSIALHARAPGTELCNPSNYQANETKAVMKEKVVNDFTYDIWGEHLFGLDLRSRLKEAPSVICPGNDSDTFSFYAQGPILFQKFHPRYVSTTFDPKGGLLKRLITHVFSNKVYGYGVKNRE